VHLPNSMLDNASSHLQGTFNVEESKHSTIHIDWFKGRNEHMGWRMVETSFAHQG